MNPASTRSSAANYHGGIPRIVLLAVGLLFAASTMAAEPQSETAKQQELDFSPPPVPEFMLRRPDKPLTLEEMRKQADEAARRARAERERRNPPPAQPAGDEGERNK